MGLWDEVEDLDIDVEKSPNKYLSNKENAMNLIGRILAFNNEDNNLRRSIFKLHNLIEEDLLNITSRVNVEEETKLYNELKHIKDKLYELKMLKLLSKKHIVGIGGMFSAGKSKFINSIMRYNILPENQLPTTSIPTYITRGNEKLSAYTFNNIEVKLDYEAINAISHIFYDEYSISFTNFIKSIVIQNYNHNYENIVFLDTPGYTKSEFYKKESNTDANIAKEHLAVCDYIIWLMDIENGVVLENDIDFIRSLNINKPILFIFNKADKKCENDISLIVENTKQILKNTGLNVFGVAAYSSVENKEYFNDYIKNFIEEINEMGNENQSVIDEIGDILNKYETHFEKNKDRLHIERNKVYKSINEAVDLSQIINLARLYSCINKDFYINNARMREFKKLQSKILDEVINILNNERYKKGKING